MTKLASSQGCRDGSIYANQYSTFIEAKTKKPFDHFNRCRKYL
jgi:hypothetical protein